MLIVYMYYTKIDEFVMLPIFISDLDELVRLCPNDIIGLSPDNEALLFA